MERNIIDLILILIAANVILWQSVALKAKERELDIWKQSHEVIKYQRDCLNDSLNTYLCHEQIG